MKNLILRTGCPGIVIRPPGKCGFSKEACMTNDPDFTVNASFVTYGYQIDYLADSKPLSSECRDFAGDHDIKVLQQSFYEHMQRAVEAFRKGTDKLPQSDES